MNLFRSEDHVTSWLGGREPGMTIPVTKVIELGLAWYRDRLASDWRPHTRDQNQAILNHLDLVGEFWRLP
jgi:hypothetical protein